MEKYPVKLYIYDISRGMAKQMSPMLLGKQIEGIWHTGVVCYDREYFFGGGGIESCLPGGTILGPPDKVVDLGCTEIDKDLFLHFIRGLAMQNFRPESYHLFEHNCNTFSNEVAMFLTGSKIPQHIQDLPADVLNSAFGQMIKPMIDSMSVRPSGGSSVADSSSAFSQPGDIFEPRASHQDSRGSTSAAGTEISHVKEPVMHSTSDISQLISQLKENQKEGFDDSEVLQLDDMERSFSSGTLVNLKEEHIQLLGKVLSHGLDSYGKDALYPVTSVQELSMQPALELMQVMATHKQFTSYPSGKWIVQKLATKFPSLATEAIQVKTVHVLCNTTSNKTGHTNLLSSADVASQLTSIVVTSLLESEERLQGSAAELAFNLSRFKVNEDISMECSTAVIEVLKRSPTKNTVRHCLHALRNFGHFNPEVLTLAHVMGVNPKTYEGDSTELDQVCQDLQKLMS